MTLFIDVDDTLVLYDKAGPNPYGAYKGAPWSPNLDLIWNIKKYRQLNPWELIIIWSGGGKEYAEMWARELKLDDIAIGMCKDKLSFDFIKDGDIVIDDMELGGLRTHNPFEWSVDNGHMD